VETNEAMVSNHVFMGNTRVASIVKHKDEPQPATYYYSSDHLGSSSVLTNNDGSYHERIEYLPYGEVWVEDAAINSNYRTPYKFTGKELDKETGLYYFGARYYDARMSRWISTDPALAEGKYFPKPNDYDTEHDFYWYILNDASGKLPGMGGVYNAHNLNVYCYSLNNPVKYYDPDGNVTIAIEYNPFNVTGAIALQIFEGKSLLKLYTSWVTRGVNRSGQEVAIKSGYYSYVVVQSKNFRGELKPLLENGNNIETEGPNANHQNKKVANAIMIHEMNKEVIKSPSHGNKEYVGSEGCQGPQGKKEMQKFMEGKKQGDTGTYILVRPLQPLKNLLEKWSK